jgi:hypothetical protein
VEHAPGYILVVSITYLVEATLERIGYQPPRPLDYLLRIIPGLIVLFMPIVPFLYFVVGTYYDVCDYAGVRRRQRNRMAEDTLDSARAHEPCSDD